MSVESGEGPMVLSDRRGHITQKVRIGGVRTVYLSVDEEAVPHEVFLRIKGEGATAELVCLYDVVARLMSMALQAGIPLAEIAARLQGTRCAPAGPVAGDDRIKMCDGVMDYVGRHLLVWYGGREDLAHCPAEPTHNRQDPGVAF